MPENIYAYTANETPFPQYVSINRWPDGRITIIVRSPYRDEPNTITRDMVMREGSLAEMNLPYEEIGKLIKALEVEYARVRLREELGLPVTSQTENAA